MSRLVVISNRVAVPKARGAAGAQGGLAGALNSALKKSGGLWLGWSGEESESPSATPHVQEQDGVTIATIDLAAQDVRSTPSPDKGIYKVAAACWSHLPLAVTNRVGPWLAAKLP